MRPKNQKKGELHPQSQTDRSQLHPAIIRDMHELHPATGMQLVPNRGGFLKEFIRQIEKQIVRLINIGLDCIIKNY